MITRTELDQLVRNLPKTLTQDEWRIAACVATGVHYEKSLPEIARFYSLNIESCRKWWDHFNFNDVGLPTEEKRKSKPQKSLQEYLKLNIGNTVTVIAIAETCQVSSPTTYNFINTNRSWFKKVGRGSYLIVDADKEREMSKK